MGFPASEFHSFFTAENTWCELFCQKGPCDLQSLLRAHRSLKRTQFSTCG